MANIRYCTALLVVLAIAWSGAASAQERGKPPKIQWTLAKTGQPLEREALIKITDREGKPIAGATVQVDVDMPSMPGMHRVPTAQATPAGAPGQYVVRFTLEMPGEWVAKIEMKKPQRVKAIMKFYAD